MSSNLVSDVGGEQECWW